MNLRPSDYAWIVLATGVVLWDVLCPRGELLSQAVDRYRRGRPITTHLSVAYVALHLTRLWPRRCDPLYLLAVRLAK